MSGDGGTRGRQAPVLALVAVLAAGALALALTGGSAPGQRTDAALPVLAGVLFAASLLVVRFRSGRDVDGVTLVEAALAPLLYAFAAPVVVATVAVTESAVALVRRDEPVKGAFNVAQWSFAAGLGALVVDRASTGPAVAVVLALVAVGLANNAAFTTVLALAGSEPPRALLRSLAPVILAGWLVGFGVNLLLGLLFVAAYEGSAWSVVLFPVPVLVLHLAYRGYATVRTDRQRLAGLHRASRALVAPLDPLDAVPAFLQEVAETFGAASALLVLDGRAHRYPGATGDPGPLEDALLRLAEPVRVARGDAGPLGALLREAGATDLLAAPLHGDGDAVVGALAVLDRAGVEGLPTGELDVLAAAAREAQATLARGRLLADVLEERRKLDELVSTSSDGIASLDPGGVVRSWNPALERLTGLPASDVVGVPGALAGLGLRTQDGEPVSVQHWDDGDLPRELALDGPDGPRRVVCSYSRAAGTDTLVVVARDVTPAQEFAELRAQFARLVEAEAAQRLVVEHLQRAVMPSLPAVSGSELGVRYVASDPSEPTGGDLYDCQVLPDGTVHLAVVDVLGHGVQATQHALSVAHTLRTVVLDGTPLGEVVARADLLLGRQDPDLVATVVLARYTPATGALQLAGGGHPPPLVVGADGRCRQLDVPGGPVGWPLAGSDGVVEDALGPGDALVLYTDGLVEARKDIVQGLEDLSALAGSLSALPAAAFAEALVDDALRGADRRDDTLALVLRRAPSDGEPPVRRRWELDALAEQAGGVRRGVTAWVGEQAGDPGDTALVLGELLANAVVAGHERVAVEARVERYDGAVRLHLEVCDDGGGFEAVPAETRASDEHGRGLAIVRALVEDLTVRSSSTGTSVGVVLALPGGPAAPIGPAR